MTSEYTAQQISQFFKVIGNPFRIRLLLEIGEGEACVCHLETVLGTRQAYISQHLMVLRDKGILETRREGKFVFYRLAKPELLQVIRDAITVLGFAVEQIPELVNPHKGSRCPCPKCADRATAG